VASRFRIPQPDRDAPFGQRPQDTLNRVIPGQQGRKGTMTGLGQSNSFKPRQQAMQRRTQPQSAQKPGVQMSFAGDPDQIARTFQALVNNTGRFEAPQPTTFDRPDVGQGRGIPDLWPDRVQDQLGVPDPQPAASGSQPPSDQPPSGQPQQPTQTSAPAISTPATEFASLQDYFNAVGRLDLVDETAYQRFGGWTPQLPEYAQQKIALDNALQSELVGAVGSQETAKAMQRLILSRLIEDELEDQATNRETAAARGLFSSSIRTDDAGRINRGYMREAGSSYADLVSRLMGSAQGLNTTYGNYLTNVLGLSSEEAQALFDRGLGGGGTPDVKPPGGGKGGNGSGGGNKNKSKKKNTKKKKPVKSRRPGDWYPGR
jgi:hypothetical protein